ncbi:MAG: ABC transporter ATP-binding protein [Saprospiraceae bacterium]|nr:ABC transporter ATP-binding protein [Saprospiraceae bacterium]
MQQSKKFNISLLAKVLQLASPYRMTFFITALLAVLLAPLGAARPYLINTMVDKYVFQADAVGMTKMSLLLLGLLFLETLLQYVFNFASGWLGQAVVYDLRTKVFGKIIGLRLQYFDTTPIGTSTTRTISDIETINGVFSEGIINIIADLLALIVVLGMMLYTNWKLTLVCMSVLPLLILASYIFKEKVKASFEEVRTQIAKMNAFLQERISGMKIVQIFGAEKKEMEKFKVINRDYTQANLNSILYYAVFFPVVEILSAAALGLLVWWGAKGVIEEEITLGVLVAFPLYINMLFRPIRMLADKFNTLQMGLVAADRVFTLIEEENNKDFVGTSNLKSIKGNIEFKNVSFSYNNSDLILKDISFELKPEETLAIIGSTGSGKSTIINLLNRFYEIQQGAILIDGNNIQTYDVSQLRSRMAMVLQDVFLFSGSIFENITLRNPSISREQVLEASKMIGAHEFIMRLPNGYDYQVMERGATLSTGQRQLVSFVRALVFKPDILILDEATSSVDTDTESVIQHAIEKLIDKRTSIIIAHRLSTIRHADKILVIERGELIEFGTPSELLQKQDGRFKELYDIQAVSPVD